MDFPTMVCLCGSTKFKDAFIKANLDETMEGHIVLTVGSFGHIDGGITESKKIELDILHLRKIELCDEILVINVNGYIGESTRREIAYARSLGKTVRFLVDEAYKPLESKRGK